MSITPQAIKDQEFQVKFRGYDAIEVKAYLELLAEEFFELHELRRKQEEEYAGLHEETQALRQEKENLAKEASERDERYETSVKQFLDKDEIIADLQLKVEELEQKVEESELEKGIQQEAWERQETVLREEIEMLKGRINDNQNIASESSTETGKLQEKIAFLESQLKELKQEEVDFKATLVAAQKFADDMRAKATAEAAALVAEAHKEVDTFRRDAEEELSILPLQIEELQLRKKQVREELKAILNSYLDQLDIVQEGSGVESDEDLSDLFQSISLNGDDALEEEDLNELGVE
jgi:cell division initiation protein